MSRWIRLDTTWSASEWLAALDPLPRLLWPELLCYVKAHGTSGKCRRGVDALRRVTGVTRDDVTTLETAALEHGALVLDGGDWVVTGWGKYQSDETNAERQRRHRASASRLSQLRQSRVTGVTSRSVTDVTPTVTVTETVTTDLAKPDPVSEMWAVWIEELGGKGALPVLTASRKQKLRAMYDEHLRSEDNPLGAFRAVLHAVKHSDHHMGNRDYQMPESLFRSQDRRDKWWLASQNGNGSNGHDWASELNL